MESEKTSRVYSIWMESELRFSVGEANVISLELLIGSAEIFGFELVPNKIYKFPPYSSVSVFTWKGCKVELRGTPEWACVTGDTLMKFYFNVVTCLEEMRMVAADKDAKGPVSLVVGPMQSGKTSFCRLVLNSAVRMGMRPLFIDLDVGQNFSSIPGVMSVLRVEKPLNVTDTLNKTDALSVFQFGYTHMRKKLKLYYLMIKKLGEMLQGRLPDVDPNIRSSGVVIDTSGCVRGAGYKALILAAHAFHIDAVFVIADENLYTQLRSKLPWPVHVVYVPRCKGIVMKSTAFREDFHANRVWEYFYGSIEMPLKSYEFEVKFSDVDIYTIEESGSSITDLFKISYDDVNIVRTPIGPGLMNRVLGLSFADVADENLIVTSVKGFICVLGVDMEKEVLRILSPQPAPLPSKILIMGDIQMRKYSPQPHVKRVDYSKDE